MCEGVINERGRFEFQEMNFQADDEKSPGREAMQKDLDNEQFRLE